MDDKRILRVLDVNFNRLKEALRVVEDIFRFIFADDLLRKKSRSLRHSLDVLIKDKKLQAAILERNSRSDLGQKVDILELKRKDSLDVLFVNFQRAKESARVLEEFFKIVSPSKISVIKKIRYNIYSLEKDAQIFKRK
ncbi:MAG: thiamine-phosphate pyrophosphorylase [Candidatus Omnitrophota bacterium]|jgi:thiamine-phosphate pyrophosphorylase